MKEDNDFVIINPDAEPTEESVRTFVAWCLDVARSRRKKEKEQVAAEATDP